MDDASVAKLQDDLAKTTFDLVRARAGEASALLRESRLVAAVNRLVGILEGADVKVPASVMSLVDRYADPGTGQPIEDDSADKVLG